MLHEASDFYNKPQSNWHFLNFWTKRPISNPAYGHFKTGIFFVFWKKWAFSKRSFFEKIKKRAFPKRPFFENLISKRAFFKFSNGKKKQWPGKKKTGYISWWLKISDKKPMVCHGHFWLCHGHNFRNCHGHFSFVTGIFWPILSRATRPVSRAKFGVFCHGHFYKVTGTFSTNVTGKPKSVTGKKQW